MAAGACAREAKGASRSHAVVRCAGYREWYSVVGVIVAYVAWMVCVCVCVSQARTGQTDSDVYANESPSVGRCVCFATVEPKCCCDDLALPCCTEQRCPTRDAGNDLLLMMMMMICLIFCNGDTCIVFFFSASL